MEVGYLARPIYIDRLDFSTQLRIAAVGEHTAVVLLVLFTQQFSNLSRKPLFSSSDIQQSHCLIREHLAVIQKCPKLLMIGNFGRKTADDISIVGQVDEPLQGGMGPLCCSCSIFRRVSIPGC